MAFPTAILVFLATFVLAAAAVWIARMTMDRFSPPEPEYEPNYPDFDVGDGETPLLIRESKVSSISVWGWILQRFNLSERLKIVLMQADLSWSVGRVTLMMLLFATISFALINEIYWMPLWGTLAFSLLFGILPYLYIAHRKQKRWHKVEEQFPDAMESIARAMRAGYAFAGAFDNVANQLQGPLGKEFRRATAEAAFGAPWELALNNLSNRLPLPEVCMFTAAIQMQGKSGGNISEVLEKLAENMRESVALHGEVRSISAQGRITGYVLTALPIAIAFLMSQVSPQFLDPLFTDETGKTMLVAAILGLVVAHFVIRKLVDIKL